MFGTTLRRRRGVAAGALLTAAALLVTACSGSEDPATSSSAPVATSEATGGGSTGSSEDAGTEASSGAQTPEGGTDTPASGSFTVGLGSFFLTHFAPGQSSGSYVSTALFTPPMQLDPATQEVVPAAAESLETEDQQTWTLTFPEGWTFHDGEPVTAQSYADSWNTTATAANVQQSGYLLAGIEGYAEMNPTDGSTSTVTELSGVTVVDDYTLEVKLVAPDATFPYTLTASVFAPIPTSAAADLNAFDLNPIGNGPFMMTGGGMTEGAAGVTLEAYPDYQGTKAKAQSVTLKSFQDTAGIYTDFQAGGIDLGLIDGNDLANAKTAFPDQVVPVDYPALMYLGFPTWDTRFADVKVRQAFSMAIDRQGIVDALLKGNGTPAVGLAPDTLVGGGESDCEACSYDPTKAAALLAEAGGFSGSLTLYTYTDPTNQVVLEAIANQLRTNLGIDAVAETQEIAALYDSFKVGTTAGPSLLYAGVNVPSVYGMVSALFTEGAILNTTKYSSETVTDLMAEAVGASSVDDLTKFAQEASAAALADLQIAPLYHPVGGLLHDTNLSGVTPELLGGPNLASVVVS